MKKYLLLSLIFILPLYAQDEATKTLQELNSEQIDLVTQINDLQKALKSDFNTQKNFTPEMKEKLQKAYALQTEAQKLLESIKTDFDALPENQKRTKAIEEAKARLHEIHTQKQNLANTKDKQ